MAGVNPMSSGADSGVGSGPFTPERRAPWGRRLAIATAVVYVISGAFPLAAGLSHHTDSFPSWWGAADVAVAFVLAMLALAIFTVGQGRIDRQVEERSYAMYRIATHAVFAMLLAFFLFGDRIVWSNCLTGFGWRYWLLLYGLPAWLATWAGGAMSTPRR